MKSTWLETFTQIPEYPKLEQDLRTDVAIIGGGLAGIMIAYQLAQTGKKVTLLEKGRILRQDTAYTTAFLTQVTDTTLACLIKMYGLEKAKLSWQAGQQAIDEIERIINQKGIDCEFKRAPLYLYATNDKEYEILAEEHAAIQQCGFASKLSHAKLGFNNHGSLKIPSQAKFHSVKFGAALADLANQLGVQIFEDTKAEKIKNGVIHTGRYTVRADQIVVATQVPFNKPPLLRFKKGVYISYVFEVRLPVGVLAEAMFLDIKHPYHYIRVDHIDGYDRMIIGGEDHRKDIPVKPAKNYAALEDFLKKLLPGVNYEIIRRWHGPIPESIDGLPFIGKYKNGQYLAAAFSGNGITYSCISSILIRDLITGKKNEWQNIYDPKRKIRLGAMWQKGKDYTLEFFGGAFKNIFGIKH